MYEITEENITRVENDANGNPRYVFHFLALSSTYIEAVNIASELLGAKKYRSKSYGGGIVFQSINIRSEIERINKYVRLNQGHI